jgi:hypothetical protein
LFRLPYLAAALALYLGIRFIAHRRSRSTIRLRDGRRVKLISSVALLDGSPGDLLALEYSSPLPEGSQEEVQREAQSLVELIGARAQYATCRCAVVAVRREGRSSNDPASAELTFTFRRGESKFGWYPTDGLE